MGGGAGGASAGLGGAGQESQGGSLSSPSVPLSQAAQAKIAKRANELTIQERRRLARRAQAVGTGRIKPYVASANVATPSKPARASLSQPSTKPVPILSPRIFEGSYKPLDNNLIKRAYSQSGFDLIGALLKVAQRPNPKIDIGAVDLSCSFTVSDAQHPDQPIVHCSDSFCELTGYSRDEIVGRNCRFLQSPDGKVESGSERIHTDNGAVKHLKKHCTRIQECQASLINYRRDGSPFINLVTIVPIGWGDSTEPVFLVGFQVDLVEHPGAVLERSSNGLYVVNYNNDAATQGQGSTTMSEDVNALQAKKDHDEEEKASKQGMMAQELAELIGSGSTETTKWARVLLENSNDLIHVLSLKGTFLYVSPSVERLLGYKAEEMVGKSISEFCHPSDVVPVFRELKDSTSNASIAAAAKHWARVDGTVNPITKGGAGQTGPQVNLVMRMRHKTHGHKWIENNGKLHLEQGKGRKVVISSGRSRPVYNLPWEQARRSLDSKGPDFWSKVSHDGLILSTSGTVADVLGAEVPSKGTTMDTSLAGMHLRDVTNGEAMKALHSGLHSLNVSGIPHLMNNGQGGESVTVMSTLIPSSAGGEGLPTIFVHTQRVNPLDLGTMQLNQVHSQVSTDASNEANQSAALLKKGEASPNSVFSELATHRSSSWVFELHQLKIANKRLREEIRSHQRRLSGGVPRLQVAPPPSPSKSKPTPTKTPTSRSFLAIADSNSGSGSNSDNSFEPSPSPFSFGKDRFDLSGSGSGSDATVATSVISSGTPDPVRAGVKRSRS